MGAATHHADDCAVVLGHDEGRSFHQAGELVVMAPAVDGHGGAAHDDRVAQLEFGEGIGVGGRGVADDQPGGKGAPRAPTLDAMRRFGLDGDREPVAPTAVHFHQETDLRCTRLFGLHDGSVTEPAGDLGPVRHPLAVVAEVLPREMGVDVGQVDARSSISARRRQPSQEPAGLIADRVVRNRSNALACRHRAGILPRSPVHLDVLSARAAQQGAPVRRVRGVVRRMDRRSER